MANCPHDGVYTVPSTSTTTQPIAARIPNEQADQLRRLAGTYGLTVNDVIRVALDNTLPARNSSAGNEDLGSDACSSSRSSLPEPTAQTGSSCDE
jgi:hypothetical protein